MWDEGAESLRVVVRFDERQVEADLPLDWPIAHLVPELLAIIFGAPDAAVASKYPWLVRLSAGEALLGASTLRELRLPSGTALLLEPVHERPGPGPANGSLSVDDIMLPRQRTLAALPARQNVASRLAGILGALVDGEPGVHQAPPGPGGGRFVSPEQLTVARRPGALERGRQNWRGSAYERRLDEAIQEPQLKRCVTIAVMSPKGGVGKTTVSALLGTLFALVRRDRIVAVDSNPDFGSLGRSLTPGHDVFVDDLLEVLDSSELTATALDANLGRAMHGLMVLPVPSDPVRMARLDEFAYARVIRRLQGMVGMVLLDCGTGLHDAAARAALRTADQVLLVTDGDPSTASLVAEAAARLSQESVPIWLVANRVGPTSQLELSALESFVPHARGLLLLPEHRPGASRVASGTFDWRDAPASWKIAVREMAVALVVAWHDLGLGTWS